MDLRDLVAPDAVIPALAAEDKKAALATLSEVAAGLSQLKSRDVFAAVWQREQMGSTAVGRGIAIPHGRLAGVDRIRCVFARLEKPVAYDSHDGQPVDLMFLLLGPKDSGADHLKALARISRVMREPDTAETLRATRDPRTLYAVLTRGAVTDLPKAG